MDRKVFVTPKITITRPGEESPTLRVVPEHRLENVKYILQCKILKRQHLAGVQAPQSPQVASVTMSQHTPSTSTSEMSWIEPKVEVEEFINIPKGQIPKKPSPAKTPQDVARVLDFSADKASESATKRDTVEKVVTNSLLHIKNYSLKASKESPVKEETGGTRAVDVARLVARINNVTFRKNFGQSADKALNTTESMSSTMEIPKATIRCKKLPVQNKQNLTNMPNREERHSNENAKGAQLMIHNEVGLTTEEKTVIANPREDPSKTSMETLNEKATIVASTDNQHNEQSQFDNFPVFSPLKQPFPVVTHSQDLPLPTISTFKTPFPTTLIKVGQMGQARADTIEKTSENFLKNTYFVTPAVPIPITQTPKSLIVLENKVLSQDEKIDLTALGFGTPKIESTPEVTMATSEIKACTHKAQETEQIPQTNITSSSNSATKNLLSQKGAKFNNRTIISMDKLKLSSDKIVELVKAIQLKNANSSKHILVVRKAENVAKASDNPGVLSKININDASSSQTNATAVTLIESTENSASVDFPLLHNNATSTGKPTETPISQIPNIPVAQTSELYTSTVTQNTNPQQKLSPLTQNDFVAATATTYFAPFICPEVKNLAISQFKNPLPPNPQKLTDSGQNAHQKSSVCVLDSGDESDSPISAVDFIASLAAENPITEDMKLELSPEELNLNASFAMNFSPLRIPNRDRTESLKSEIIEQDIYEAYNASELFEPEMVSDDVRIGKIITISEENILKAVAASTKLEINSEQTNVGAQELFKLTKNTEHLDTIQEESQVDNLENVNNLDIVTTDSLTESTVGPIIVKNIEIGAIDNFEEGASTGVIVKNMENGMAESIGKICKNIGVVVPDNQIRILPLEGEALSQSIMTVEEGVSDADKSYLSKISEEQVIANTMEASQTTAAIGDVTNVGNKNTEIVPSLEVYAKVSISEVEENNIDEVLSPHNSNTLAESAKEVRETINTESVTVNTETEAECPVKPAENSILTPVPNSHLNNEKNAEFSENMKPAVGENSKASPKRLPRFKRGKINLVQRKKTTLSIPVKKQEIKSVSQNRNEASSEQKQNEKKFPIKEIADPAKLGRETNEEAEKMNEDKNLHEKETAIEKIADTSELGKQITEGVENIIEYPSLNEKEHAIEGIADTAKLDSDTKEKAEKMNEDQKRNGKESAVEEFDDISKLGKETNEWVEKTNEGQNLNAKKTVTEDITVTSKLDSEINEGVEKINETVAQTNKLKPEVEKSETLSHYLAAKVDANEGVVTEQVLVVEHNNVLYTSKSERPACEVGVSDISVPDILPSNESSLKSVDLKRKTAIISELLHPPKIPKRKSVSTDITSDTLRDVSTEQISSTDNLLLSAVNTAMTETKVAPAKNSFKKTKIEAIGELNKDFISSEAENVASDKTVEEHREVVSAEGNLEKNHTQKKLHENYGQKSDRFSERVQQEAQLDLEFAEENKPQFNTANSENSVNSAITETEEVHKTSKNCDILHVITEEKLLEQNSKIPEKMAKEDTPSTEDVEKPGHMKSDFLGFNHNSPSTLNIESNLQHILTITTSAEKTKTREVDHSTAERESPHVSLNDSSVKGSSTTGKTTTRKSNLVQRRKPANRRSVPLKKRWGVLHESDGEINIIDDISPADDDGEEDDEPSFEASDKTEESLKNMKKLKTYGCDTNERKSMEREEEEESSLKDRIATSSDETVIGCLESKKRNRCSEDSIDIFALASDSVTIAENTISEDLQASSKKVRSDTKFGNISDSNPTENSTSIATETETELSEKPHANVSKLEKTSKGSATNEAKNDDNSPNTSTRASVDSVINIEETSETPKSNGGHEHKPRILLIDLNNSSAAEASIETTKSVYNNDSSLLGTASISGKHERGSSEDFREKKEVDNEKLSVCKTSEIKKPVAKAVEILALQPISGKKRGRKPKFNVATATTSTVKAESEPSEPNEKNVDCSMNESVKREVNESRKVVVEKVKTLDLSTFLPQEEFSTSTPTLEKPSEDGTKKRGRKRKLPVEAVEEDKNETMNNEESTPVVYKKRGRKPKSSLLLETEEVVRNSVAEAEKAVDVSQKSFQQDLNETLPNSSANISEAMSASQTTTEFETPIKIPKKRGRKPKALLATPNTPADRESPKPTEKQQGRKVKAVDLETRGGFNERLLLITNRSQLDTVEVLTADPVAKTSKTRLIECGLCLQQMERHTWVNHLARHYGVGWIVGEMAPIVSPKKCKCFQI